MNQNRCNHLDVPSQLICDWIARMLEYEEYYKITELLREDSIYCKSINHEVISFIPQLIDTKNELENKLRENPMHFETAYQLASVCELLGENYQALDYYHRALELGPSKHFQHKIINCLKVLSSCETEEIPAIFQKNIKTYLGNGEIEKVVCYIGQHSKIDPVYQAELDFFKEDLYLQQFIIRLLLGDFNDYPILTGYDDYINGNIYFYYHYYDEALACFNRLNQNFKSPIVLRNQAYLNQAAGYLEEARKLYQQYLNLLKEEGHES